MKILISTPNININISKVVGLLRKLNYLDSFWTTIYLPFKFKFFKKRYYEEINFKYVKFNFYKEIMRKLCIILNLKKFYYYDKNIFSVDAVNKDLDKKVSKYLSKNQNINIIYSYEDCSKKSFQVAKLKKIKTVYDLTSPYWLLKKNILDEELQLYPDWKLSSTEILTEEKCKIKDQEINLSDQIVVASSFTAKSLELFRDKKKLNIEVIPYGIDSPNKKIINKRKENEKFKILFVGRPTLSKGIQYLIQSLSKLDFPWEVEIAGSIPETPDQISQKLVSFFKDDRCKFLGQITNDKLLKKMNNNHVFLFPSMFEGFGQVLLEAFSCGLPVITTFNTGGYDIIEDGKNGFLTPIRDYKITTEVLNNFYNDDELRISIAENAYSSINNYSWQNYQKN